MGLAKSREIPTRVKFTTGLLALLREQDARRRQSDEEAADPHAALYPPGTDHEVDLGYVCEAGLASKSALESNQTNQNKAGGLPIR